MSNSNAVFTTRLFRCSVCDHSEKVLGWDYSAPPQHCQTAMDYDYGQFEKAPLAVSDSIRGGIDIRHGLCNDDGSPKRFYSKSEIKREAAQKGLSWGPLEHVGERGSDKSKHTSRWI